MIFKIYLNMIYIIILNKLVDTGENGLKSVSYIPMIAMLIDVVKKQQQRIEEIEKIIGK